MLYNLILVSKKFLRTIKFQTINWKTKNRLQYNPFVSNSPFLFRLKKKTKNNHDTKVKLNAKRKESNKKSQL